MPEPRRLLQTKRDRPPLEVTPIKRRGQRNTCYIADVAALAAEMPPLLQENDLVLTLGAGNIVKVGEELLLLLEQRQR